ncbi:energy transducer TonB [Chitinophaga sp. 212800010-3]|uniref:energy transducer TonB n=1 Tax=unclassified Chitinophaga TaxID=2619133 RepID=UPI002DE42112|nr:Protein TonB [Chitinophaga sp. 212800010-3]
MDSTNIPGSAFLDILFEGRNKDYGAYELRSRYNKRVRNAIMGTGSIMLVLIGGYALNNTLRAADHVRPPEIARKIIQLDEVKLPDPDPVIPPPPVHATPPPAARTEIFVTPTITDKEVKVEEEMKSQKELKSVNIGVAKSDGVEGGADVELLAGDGGGTGVITVEKPPKREEPFTIVEIMPEFPGGMDALAKYLGNNIRYPAMAQDNGIEGIVTIQFVVNTDGSITDAKILGAHKGGGLEEEAMRVVRKMPKWRPGKQGGRFVPVYFNLPVNFRLQQ